MPEHKIVQKDKFTLVGIRRSFATENSYAEIPKFWRELFGGENEPPICGTYGLCETTDKDTFDYYIADDYPEGAEIPDGYELKVIPAGTWAVFPCRGALPKALQDLSTEIWNSWLPSCKTYKLAADYDIEMYTEPHENPDDDYSEIWLPVKKVRLRRSTHCGERKTGPNKPSSRANKR